MPFDEHGSVLGQALPGGRHSDPADHRQRRDRANAETDDGLEETNLVHVYRGDLDEKRATIRMRSRCRGVGQDARVD